jgi:UDP-N-acetylmuramoylalanine--D-glutamate ligase
MMFSTSNDVLAGRRVLVLGFGRQGQALARWLPMVGAHVIVNDQRGAETLNLEPESWPHVTFVLGGHPQELLEHVDLICVSGGVSLNLPLLDAARAQQIPITNDAQLFLERCPAPVIGITGSAGKTTTTTLVGEICKEAGLTTWVGGNIGSVLLDMMRGIRPDHQVVMELSSFQLELMHTSPAIGAILNVTPNHLDRHGSMEAYMRAKARLLAFQSVDDVAILSRDDPGSLAMETVTKGQILWFSMREMLVDGAFMVGQRLVVAGAASPDGEPHVICERNEIPLRGEHNVMNVLAACAIAGAAGIAPEVMTTAIKSFQPVPHRLETVRVVNGVTYVNDSIATAPERVVAALKSYDDCAGAV